MGLLRWLLLRNFSTGHTVGLLLSQCQRPRYVADAKSTIFKIGSVLCNTTLDGGGRKLQRLIIVITKHLYQHHQQTISVGGSSSRSTSINDDEKTEMQQQQQRRRRQTTRSTCRLTTSRCVVRTLPHRPLRRRHHHHHHHLVAIKVVPYFAYVDRSLDSLSLSLTVCVCVCVCVWCVCSNNKQWHTSTASWASQLCLFYMRRNDGETRLATKSTAEDIIINSQVNAHCTAHWHTSQVSSRKRNFSDKRTL